MTTLIYQWIDLLWLPVALLVVHKQHRIKAAIFIIACILTMRTQIELMEVTGYPAGFLPFIDTPLYTRGLITYSIIYTLFLLLAYFSPGTQKMVFFAVCITIYIIAFCLSMLVMVI